MKRTIACVFAFSLVLGASGLSLAQDDAAAPKGGRAFSLHDANGDGKITKEEFLAAAQKRAEARFAKLDKDNKGYLTKEDFIAARTAHGKGRKAAAPAAQ
ncbi:EF-hand domain-containing protein [Fundidesulfovibrio terrae]|uniref:EF-hand domain-containing protein n=1 Tax=Fundidesulfovibrio terrae TaxID=2922866 RepID=UPI001FB03F25|nr:EF-hand domain-containing protein [Fundidesulfovibrio terrae]